MTDKTLSSFNSQFGRARQFFLAIAMHQNKICIAPLFRRDSETLGGEQREIAAL